MKLKDEIEHLIEVCNKIIKQIHLLNLLESEVFRHKQLEQSDEGKQGYMKEIITEKIRRVINKMKAAKESVTVDNFKIFNDQSILRKHK